VTHHYPRIVADPFTGLKRCVRDAREEREFRGSVLLGGVFLALAIVCVSIALVSALWGATWR
jgi:hypothetical protein